MLKVRKSVIAACLALTLIGFSAARSEPQINNYTTPGNLESKHDLGCVALTEVRPDFTPVDIYRGMAECVDEKKFDAAVRLSALAGVYGRYDTMRVADRSAHQAVSVVQMTYLGDRTDEEARLIVSALKSIANDAQRLEELCRDISNVGAPTYYPKYMIQHGMGAFMGGSGNGLVKDFNGPAAFASVMDSYLHCKK